MFAFDAADLQQNIDDELAPGSVATGALDLTTGRVALPDTHPIDGEFPLQKRRYSCFVGTDLDLLLRGLKVDTVVLVGAMTNVCVHYTFVDAHHLDYHAHVVTDAVYGSDWAFVAAASSPVATPLG